MGAAGSKIPGKTMTGVELKNQTEDVKNMANALFQFMYSEWKQGDTFEIADNPGDYVIALSDMITAQFHVLGYTTKKNKIGEIYFEKYDRLDPPKNPEEMERLTNNTRRKRALRSQKGAETQRRNAEIIAFYFVRIFQILGSLLLVVKDINFPVVDSSGQVVSTKITNANRAYTEGAYQILPKFRPLQMPPQMGGLLLMGGSESLFPASIPLGPFEFLRYYLRKVDDETLKKYETYSITTLSKSGPNNGTLYKFFNSSNLFFEYTRPDPEPERVTMDPTRGGKQNLVQFLTSGQGTPQMESIEMYITRFQTSNPLDGFVAPGSLDKNKQLERYPLSIGFELRNSNRKLQDAILSRSETTRDNYINGVEYRFMEGTLVESISSEYDTKKDFVVFMERISLTAIRKKKERPELKLFAPKVIQKEEDEEKSRKVKAPKNPALAEIFDVMVKDKTDDGHDIVYRPHCISRALQLLDAASINGLTVKKGMTSVCKLSVGDDTKEMTGSLYKPLKSAAQLFGKINPIEYEKAVVVLKAFVGKNATKEPLSVSDLKNAKQDSESSELANALKRLGAAFKSTESINSVSDIKIGKPRECKDRDTELDVPLGDKFNKMKSTSQKLLAYHVNQVIEISKFLKSVFNIKQRPDGSWQVEGPKTEILFAGFPVLDTLTDQARFLLINYYSGCEEIYQSGLDVWKASEAVAVNEVPK